MTEWMDIDWYNDRYMLMDRSKENDEDESKYPDDHCDGGVTYQFQEA